MLTVVVDAPDGWRARSIVDELTADAGLVTSEFVPRVTAQRNSVTSARLESEENEPGGTK